jgi:ATP-binding cassette subfamily B protein
VSTQQSSVAGAGPTRHGRAGSLKPSAGNGDGAHAEVIVVAQAPLALADFRQSEVAAISNASLLRWMFGFLRPVRLLCLLACVYLTLSIGLEVLTTRQMGNAVDHIKDLHAGSTGSRHFWPWLLGGEGRAFHLANLWHILRGQDPGAPLRDVILLLVALMSGLLIFRYLREVANIRLSMTLVYYIREAVYDKLQRVGFGFHDAISTGQLINRALTDLQNVRVFVQTAVLTTLEIGLVVGGYMILLAMRNPWVALLSLVPLPIWTLYTLGFGKRVQPASKAVMESEDKNVSLIAENIAGVHVVKAFASQHHETERYTRHCDGYIQRVLARIRMYATFTPVIRGIASASHLSLFFLVAVFIIKGRMGPGDLLILGTAMGAILQRLQQVSVISEQYQNAIVSSRRLYEVLHAPATVPELPEPLDLPKGTGEVVFHDVTFGYDPLKPVLKDVSFRVPGGGIVAIVGPTGAGKTTLVSLIARFYDPQAGTISIDGADVRDLSLSSLRTQVAFVFQETYLFSDTVAANIAYGRPHIRGGEIEAASRLAQAHEFVEQLPKGYDTMLGERGASLSGGQRQRLAIARAILFNPRILVLDDATAAVDPETEDLIRRGMGVVMRGRTTFLIAHRISTVKRADVVIVLEHGRVTQIGTHDQLMRQDGHYRDIAAAQLYGDESAVPRGGPEDPSHMWRVQNEQSLRETTAAAKEQQQRAEEDV